MKLSVCLIARNESSRLADAINSVRAIADEIIVTDTGSTDDTVELAKRLGAKVSHYAWTDDFAAARNACQQYAAGEWILWLDADERLKPGCEKDVREAMANPRAIAYQIIRQDFFALDRPDWFSEMHQLRLVRRDLPAKFVGVIHEHLSPEPVDIARGMGKEVLVSNIRFQHWGYIAERLPEKIARAAVLCEKELQLRPGQLYYLVELARALFEIKSPKAPAVLAEAAAVMLQSRASPRAPTLIASSLIEQLFAFPSQKLVPVDELIALTHRWFPRNAPLIWAVARTHALRGEWPQAEQQLRHLLKMLDTGTHDRYMSFDPRITEDARFNLGVALIRQAKLDEAETVYTALLQSPRRGKEAQLNLDAIAKLRVLE
ncbi:MAG: glycosyltransferase family 2 protein [Planctomycetes bacterium]|nr:glycosyltransferase family 2 protein [Planctomycetota bacterium]